jgi:hypothetical protein
MRSDVWARRGLSVFVLLAPLVAAGDEPVGETPSANKQPPEQTVTAKPPPESTPAFEGISIEPFIPSEKVTADSAVAFPVDN